MAELEPDELAKPSSKTSKSKKQESNQSVKPAERQFQYKSESLWNDTFPEKLKQINSVIKHSVHNFTSNDLDNSSDRRSQSPEAINYAFKGSNGDLHNPLHEKQPNGVHHHSPKRTPSMKSENKSSKLSLSSSFSRKKYQEEHDGGPLMTKQRESLSKAKSTSREFKDVELNAFDNPAMTGTVALLNQEEDSSSSSNSSPAHKPLLKEPLRQTMERQEVVLHQPSFSDEDGFTTAELKPLDSTPSEVTFDLNSNHL